MENLKVHLVLLLDSEKDKSSLIELRKREEEIKIQMNNLFKIDLQSEVALQMFQKQIGVLDVELKSIENQIHELEHLLVYISLEIDRIDNLIDELDKENSNIKSNYSIEEMLEMLDRILVFPKSKSSKANSVIFVPITKSSYQVFHLIDELLESDIYKLLDSNLIKIHEQEKTHKKMLLVKNPTPEQLERYSKLEDSI